MLAEHIARVLQDSIFSQGDDCAPNPEEPVQALVVGPPPGTCLITLRWRILETHVLSGDLTSLGLIVYRSSSPTSAIAQWIAVAARGYELRYAGGLTIFDLVTFLVLCQSCFKDHGGCLKWCGVNDEWLSICSEERRNGSNVLSDVCVPMSELARQQWRLLRDAFGDFGGVLGERSVALLDSGFELHLEGASSPLIYLPSVRVRLRACVMK